MFFFSTTYRRSLKLYLWNSSCIKSVFANSDLWCPSRNKIVPHTDRICVVLLIYEYWLLFNLLNILTFPSSLKKKHDWAGFRSHSVDFFLFCYIKKSTEISSQKKIYAIIKLSVCEARVLRKIVFYLFCFLNCTFEKKKSQQ